MTIRCTMGLAALLPALMLVGCGGGGEGGGDSSGTGPPANTSYRTYAGVTAADATHMPTYQDGRLLRVGVDHGELPSSLPTQSVPGLPGVEFRYGQLSDGVGATKLRDFLSSVGNVGERRGGYEVRVIGPSTATQRNRVLAAVQLVNAALPLDARLSVGSPLPDFSLQDTVNSRGRYFRSGRELPETIHVEFVPSEDHYDPLGIAATSWGDYVQFNAGASELENELSMVLITAHELMHTMGLRGHVGGSRFDSLIGGGERVFDGYVQPSEEYAALLARRPTSGLYPVDREALRALYGPLRNGGGPESLGPWSSTSDHILVDTDVGAFGVRASHNGYAEPWAYGTRPSTDLANNRALSGSVTWQGGLVGFTPSRTPTLGTAEIAVSLGTMTGSATFDDIQTVALDGSTAQWGDGDLAYTIAVTGNAFRQTGGDAGTLTGIFTGRSHEGAAGTLERSDLTAAFGASR